MKKYVLLTLKANSEIDLANLQLGPDYHVSRPFGWSELKSKVQRLLAVGNGLHENAFSPNPVAVVSSHQRFKALIMKVVDENISNPDFTVECFAREVGMSPAQLYRKLVAWTGYSPNDFVRHIRLQRASDLFNQQAGNVAEVAYQVGFNNLSYFSKCFRQKFNVVPSAYRKMNSPEVC